MAGDIGNRIREYLFLNKEINLPGIGNFKVYHIDQYLSNNDTIIHPPFVKIRFKESVPKEQFNTRFSKYYFDEEVESKLEVHFQSVINDVLNFGEAVIDGLGVLRMMKKGDLVFIPVDLFDTENSYLPIIDTLSFKSDDQGKLNDEISTDITIADASISHPVSDPRATPNLEDLAKIDKTEMNSKKIHHSRVKTPNYVLWGGIGLVFMLLVAFLVKQCFYNNTLESEAEIDEALMSMAASEKLSSDDDSETDFVLEERSLSSSLDNDGPKIFSFIIIVGSFRKHDNAEKLVNTLNEKGENTVLITGELFTRVGIQFESLQSNLEENLIRIREEYDRDAWHFRTKEI